MSKKPETRLQQSIQRVVKKEWPRSRWFKVWGGPFQEAGISDLLGCVEGRYVALEVKLPGKDYEPPSDIQKKFIRDIKRAGGIADVVTSTRGAVEVIREGLRSARPISERRNEVVPRKERSRFILRTAVERVVGDCLVNGDCWEFQGHKNSQGYGRVRWEVRLWRVSRLIYSLLVGPIPDGHNVLHSCDNPPCIRPDHLFTGTDQDNVDDRERKGRGVRVTGEDHHRAKLSNKQIMDIRKERKSGKSLKSLAQIFGVSVSQISHIATRRAWRHL